MKKELNHVIILVFAFFLLNGCATAKDVNTKPKDTYGLKYKLTVRILGGDISQGNLRIHPLSGEVGKVVLINNPNRTSSLNLVAGRYQVIFTKRDNTLNTKVVELNADKSIILRIF